ncbi:hypothetical protein ACFOUP_17075 [Belliella kenyensis]|uniref:Uncharacterized protein n=1 Tax=Belliella kenyensis TaxID=1472724 RepID=A0ABV8ESD0_9BACT|nr:hypothetical protein [Belliella kenyensis]MCH7402837.1 hypothetical protein [Belliella kenyensis]MDN3602543.1 hypothetical protein [Belliella kenyensis]
MKIKENKSVSQNFEDDYKMIVESSKNSVVVESEWTKDGDFFQKLTMYDDNYVPIPTLGETTLIKDF